MSNHFYQPRSQGLSLRQEAILRATSRSPRIATLKSPRVSEYFGEFALYPLTDQRVPQATREHLIQSLQKKVAPSAHHLELLAKVVLDWALAKGASHFCHWFQPLTGATAEKHDAFLNLQWEEANGVSPHLMPVEKLSAGQFKQGEPDASSFPHGGLRSTFEARGYTSLDLRSPFFIMSSDNGKTLCLPTSFVSYHGDALDVKTPLLRSLDVLSDQACNFLNVAGIKNIQKVYSTCGLEQEFFLIDRAFFHLRPDLVMCGRTLMGSVPAKNQQLSDHYFGAMPARVQAYIQEVEHRLYELGIPAKTRHNEVAPGQFEMAPIFEEANVAVDHSQLVMTVLKSVAEKHDFVCLLHEKPFAKINGSGKHMNWSLCTANGDNLLSPPNDPEGAQIFLALVGIIASAIYRHGDLLRATIASCSNDHRLGAHEAPPSIMTVFLGDTLGDIFEKLARGEKYQLRGPEVLDLSSTSLLGLMKDNTDRNRTSPFAFTGNKFEFRAVGSSQNPGLPLMVLNAAVAESFALAANSLQEKLKKASFPQALGELITEQARFCAPVIFNGDGYHPQFSQLAKDRGLPELPSTPEAVALFLRADRTDFLHKSGVLSERELAMLHNVQLERYVLLVSIEAQTLRNMMIGQVYPALSQYLREIRSAPSPMQELITKELDQLELQLKSELTELLSQLNDRKGEPLPQTAKRYAENIVPQIVKLGKIGNAIESYLPDDAWPFPKYFELLLMR